MVLEETLESPLAVVVDRILELQFEGIGRDVEHACILILLGHVVTNGVGQVGLAHSATTKEE